MAKQVKLQAASVSRAVGFLLCILGAMLDNIFLDNGLVGLVCWTVYWGMQATEGWVLVAGIKTKHGWIGAVCNTALFVLFAVAFVVRMMDFL
jgi:hypothetical protein